MELVGERKDTPVTAAGGELDWELNAQPRNTNRKHGARG